MVWNSSPGALLESPPDSLRQMRYGMGCFVEIEMREKSGAAGEALEAAFSEIKRIETMLSRFSQESITARLNAEAGTVPVRTPPEIMDLMETCLSFSELTEGAFDITVLPWTQMWESAARRKRLPSAGQRTDILSRIGYRHILLDRVKQTVFFKRPGMKVDFGAVGKGYAMDRACEILTGRGIRQAILSTGSTITSLGSEGLRFGIRNPFRPRELGASVMLQDSSVSTSAAYEQFFEIKRKKYGHLIHPQTGLPVKTDISSVSITGPSAAVCDILSTALFILGRDAGQRVLEKLSGYHAVFMTARRWHPFPRVFSIPAKAEDNIC